MPEPDASGRTAAPPERSPAFDAVLIAGGLLLFLGLLYELATPPQPGRFLAPPVLAAAGVILLWPLRRHYTVRALFLSGGFLLLLWFLVRLASILVPFMTVYLLAYLFNPLVTSAQRRFHVPRWTSALLVTSLILGVVALFGLLLVPNIVGELKTLANRLLDSVSHLRGWLATTPFLDRLEAAGLVDKAEVNARLTALAQAEAERLTRGIPNFAQGLFQSIGSALGLITTAAILPVVLFYTAKDYPYIQRRLVQLFPTFGGRRDYLVHAGSIVGSYLRGQLTISAIAAFNVSVLLVLFDVPFALLLGLLAGLLNMIPNLGSIITMIIGVLVAFIFGDPWYWDVVVVVAVLLGQGLFESSILTPRILSQQVGLHPVLIVLSLFIFGYFMGIFGLFIAVPATAILMTFYKAYRDNLTMNLPAYPPPFRPSAVGAAEPAPRTPPETLARPEAPKGEAAPPADGADG